MYRITIINDDEETVIHSPYVNDLKLTEGIIKQQINKIDYFNLSFHHNNPAYGHMRPFKTFIKVFNTKKNRYDFEGRVLAPSEDMDNSGLHTFSYECEGELAYLHDSQQRHLEFRGTPRELMETILDYHNSQVEDYKRFELGEMNVTNSTDFLYLYLSAEEDTFETIENKLLDNLGGEIQIRKVDGVKYLDYLKEIGEAKNTEIRIAKNLESINRTVDPTEIITRLTPLGERVESEDEDATDASEARLTIESVNDGIAYIDREDLIEEFGIQGGSVTWDDITLPENLLTRGQQWLDSQKTVLYQHRIGAADLFLIGLDADSFDTGNSHPVINPVMGIDERLRIVGKTINVIQPENDALTIGDKFKTLDEYQADANKAGRRVAELQNVVNRQSQRLGEIQREMDNVDDILDDIKQAIGDADIPALEESINNLNDAVSDLIDAVDAIPDYEPATETEDGLMSAEDKAKINLINLQNSVDLDEIKAKLDLITVANSIDLDDLKSRVEALENESNES